MRRKDRELKEKAEIYAVMKQCDVMDVAFINGAYPYIVPVNFGMREEDGQLILYVHGANSGTKVDLVRNNPNVAFCIRVAHQLVKAEEPCMLSLTYAILAQEGLGESHQYNEKAMAVTCVWQIAVEEITGKQKL